MSWDARVILDSISPAGRRILTVELTYPRFIHAEVMTHRVLSRSAASNRAIPTKRLIEEVKNNPVIPVHFGKNKKGMAAVEEIEDRPLGVIRWLEARDAAVLAAQALADLGTHKQLANRVLEPFQWITTIVTATRWAWLFKLRDHPDAQPEFQHLMKLLGAAIKNSKSEIRKLHTPYLREEEYQLPEDIRKKIAVARCARVSYLNRGEVRNYEEELSLFQKLLDGSGHGHWAPLEHVATAMLNRNALSGNFHGWNQFRQESEGNYVSDIVEDEFFSLLGEPK